MWFERLTLARHALDAASGDEERLGALLLVRTFGENVVVNLSRAMNAEVAEAERTGSDAQQAAAWVVPYGSQLIDDIELVQSEIDNLNAALPSSTVEAIVRAANADYQEALQDAARLGPVLSASDGEPLSLEAPTPPTPPEHARSSAASGSATCAWWPASTPREAPGLGLATDRAHRALCDAFLRAGASKGGGALDRQGRASRLRDAIIASVPDDVLDHIAGQVHQGDGGELAASPGERPKMHSAYSSAALVVSTFGPWISDPKALTLASSTGFTNLRFEQKCPTGLRGRAPNLDLVAYRQGGVVGVESKCTEYLADSPARFSEAYNRLALTMDGRWRELFDELKGDPRIYGCVDAAQLVKHYLGLRNTFSHKSCVLLYLYWEPLNPQADPIFAQHRAEADALQQRLNGADIPLIATSHAELWDSWESTGEPPPWLGDHLRGLRQRYAVQL